VLFVSITVLDRPTNRVSIHRCVPITTYVVIILILFFLFILIIHTQYQKFNFDVKHIIQSHSQQVIIVIRFVSFTFKYIEFKSILVNLFLIQAKIFFNNNRCKIIILYSKNVENRIGDDIRAHSTV